MLKQCHVGVVWGMVKKFDVINECSNGSVSGQFTGWIIYFHSFHIVFVGEEARVARLDPGRGTVTGTLPGATEGRAFRVRVVGIRYSMGGGGVISGAKKCFSE